MTNKEKLEKIMQDIRDFRDGIFCLSEKTNNAKDCTCHKYDEILDKFENIKNEII